MNAAQHWETEAKRWMAWARAAGHDAYWYYRDAFFALVPPPRRVTLEIGCGEGRVCRDLVARGHRVIGLDISPTLAALAAHADRASRYLVADGATLPFRSGAFDLVVAYNSLMDVDDMPAVVLEMARVLRPDGRLCVCITHPLKDAGRFAGRGPNAAFVIEGSYFGRGPAMLTFERNGLSVTFRSWCHPLTDYARALEEAGFLIETLREPQPLLDAPARFDDERRIPMFLMLRAVRSGPPRGARHGAS